MNRTLESYNNYAGKYEDKFSVYLPYMEQIKNFVGMLKPGSSVLDMGCGPGLNSKIFSEAGHEVSGFDFSESMIAIAEENCPEGTFTINTVEEFETDEKFDALCLSFIIVHLKNSVVESLIKKLPGMLKTDGMVYISFMTGKSAGYETTSFSESEIFFNYFQAGYISRLFRAEEFSLEYTDSLPYSETDGSVTEDVFQIFKLS